MKIRVRLAVALILALTASVAAADLSVLKAQIEKTLPRARGDVGVVIKHLESGTEVLVNADTKYPMASAFKLPILVELFYQQAAGKLSLDDRIDLTPADLHVGSGTLSQLYDAPGVQLSIHNLVNLMMRISDNSAADIILNRVGAANVTARMQTLGLSSIRVDRTTQEMILDQSGVDYSLYGKFLLPELRAMLVAVDAATAGRANDQFNKTDKDDASAADMNRLLEMLFKGQIVDRQTSDQIIEILKQCETGPNRIRGLLPVDTVVAHKTGSIGGSINDTGIVYLPYDAGHLAITVLMRDAKAPTADRERVIAEIARDAYDYFIFNK